MGALSGGRKENFELAVKKFARLISAQIHDGIYDEAEAVDRLVDALMRAARRGAEHPEWFAEEQVSADSR
jgi:hypothetical protein